MGNFVFFFSSRRRHTRSKRDWSSDVCSSDLRNGARAEDLRAARWTKGFSGKGGSPAACGLNFGYGNEIGFRRRRKTIDERSCSIVCSGSADADAADKHTTTVHAGTGDERSVHGQFYSRKTEQPRRMDAESTRAAERLGGRRARIHGQADYEIRRG